MRAVCTVCTVYAVCAVLRGADREVHILTVMPSIINHLALKIKGCRNTQNMPYGMTTKRPPTPPRTPVRLPSGGRRSDKRKETASPWAGPGERRRAAGTIVDVRPRPNCPVGTKEASGFDLLPHCDPRGRKDPLKSF